MTTVNARASIGFGRDQEKLEAAGVVFVLCIISLLFIIHKKAWRRCGSLEVLKKLSEVAWCDVRADGGWGTLICRVVHILVILSLSFRTLGRARRAWGHRVAGYSRTFTETSTRWGASPVSERERRELYLPR